MGNYLSLARNNFSQSAFIPRPTLTEDSLPDQSGKVFIITGSNNGVGFNVARILYSRNAIVYMACRTQSKADEAIAAIKKDFPQSSGKLVFLKLDLSDLATIKAAAQEFLAKETKLHWLDNNAGVMTPPSGSKGKQGHELQMATNVLGPFLFTSLLLPTLRATAAAEAANGQPRGTVRVSWAGSLAIDTTAPSGGFHFKRDADGDLVAHDFGGGMLAYGATKVANLFLAREFGRRYGDRDGVLHDAYNPGNLKSGLQVHLPSIGQLILNPFLYPAKFGAYTELYAGLSPDLQLPRDQGKYIVPWGRAATFIRPDVVAEVGDGKNSEKLWDWCERETKQYL